MGEFEHRLSAAEHVSKREATALFEKRYIVGDSTSAIAKALAGVAETFRRGRKLDGEAFADLVARVRADIVKAEPMRLVETAKPASRALPKSESHEILVLHRAPHPEGQPNLNAFMARRVHVTRKKAVIESTWAVLDVNKHLFERAIQRDIVGWHGQLTEVENSIVAAFGLTTVWTHAMRTDIVQSDQLACPIGAGLMLGRLVGTSEAGTTQRIVVGRDATTSLYIPPSPFLSVEGEDGRPNLIRPLLSTVINDDLFRPEQRSLHEGLTDFMQRYSLALAEIADSALWPGASLFPVRQYDDVLPAIDTLARELADIILAPENAGAMPPATSPDADVGPFYEMVGVTRAPKDEAVPKAG